MLARSITRFLMALVALLAIHVSQTNAQEPQPPSQRFQPVPPSVHIPAQQGPIQRLQSKAGLQQYRLGDSNVQQTSYVASNQDTDPRVPAILAGASQRAQSSPPAELPTNPQAMPPKTIRANVGDQSATSLPLQTKAGAVDQSQFGSPRVAPEELRRQQLKIEEQLRRIREQMSKEKDGVTGASEQAVPASTPVNASTFDAMQNNFQGSTNQPPQDFGNEAPPVASTTMPAPPADDYSATAQQENVRVAATAGGFGGSNPVNQVRQVSSETNSFANPGTSRQPEITLPSPSIDVQAFGPRTVGINKTANYQVIIQNLGRTDASKIVVGVDLPSWVDVDKINMTNGTKEISDGSKGSRLIWTVDQVVAGATQTLSIDAIPRKAEMFDLGVEWTYLPRTGVASVEVTQPRLEMKIAGPKDVLYGEKAIYHVTVRNPGTGTAENVHVMLPEALGGERAPLYDIEPGKEKNFQVELLARTAGELDLIATATGEGNLTVSANREIVVRRANLEVAIDGPGMKYAGSVGQYTVKVSNTGDAIASDVIAAIALPLGVKYTGGVEAAKSIEGGVRWSVGVLAPGDERTYTISCELNSAGELQIEAGARGQGDLAASGACLTKVDTIADLVLFVQDPKGPLPVGENLAYEIHVTNRGTRAAQSVELLMQFSEGIEPLSADGQKSRIVPGQVLFSAIEQIEPGQKMVFHVTAKANTAGTHVFRAQLTCSDSDSREIAEGTTRFFGDSIDETIQAPPTANSAGDFSPIR